MIMETDSVVKWTQKDKKYITVMFKFCIMMRNVAFLKTRVFFSKTLRNCENQKW